MHGYWLWRVEALAAGCRGASRAPSEFPSRHFTTVTPEATNAQDAFYCPEENSVPCKGLFFNWSWNRILWCVPLFWGHLVLKVLEGLRCHPRGATLPGLIKALLDLWEMLQGFSENLLPGVWQQQQLVGASSNSSDSSGPFRTCCVAEVLRCSNASRRAGSVIFRRSNLKLKSRASNRRQLQTAVTGSKHANAACLHSRHGQSTSTLTIILLPGHSKSVVSSGSLVGSSFHARVQDGARSERSATAT